MAKFPKGKRRTLLTTSSRRHVVSIRHKGGSKVYRSISKSSKARLRRVGIKVR